MPNYAILNQVHVNKANGTETIKVYHQKKNIYFELTMNTATKEVAHYRSIPVNDVEITYLVQ